MEAQGHDGDDKQLASCRQRSTARVLTLTSTTRVTCPAQTRSSWRPHLRESTRTHFFLASKKHTQSDPLPITAHPTMSVRTVLSELHRHPTLDKFSFLSCLSAIYPARINLSLSIPPSPVSPNCFSLTRFAASADGVVAKRSHSVHLVSKGVFGDSDKRAHLWATAGYQARMLPDILHQR